MDLLGDIVEKDPYGDAGRKEESMPRNESGFPALYKPKKVSSWKARLKAKKEKEKVEVPRSEAQSIHADNIKRMSEMSEEEIMREKQELLEQLDPRLVRNLLRNINKRQEGKAPMFAEIEGASGTWVGGYNESLRGLPALDEAQVNESLDIVPGPKKEQEEKEEEYPPLDDDDVAPLDYQMAQAVDHTANEELLKDVHFVSQSEDVEEQTPLSLDDPDFDEKLHARYFPQLPRDIDRMQWMQPVDSEAEPESVSRGTITAVSDCRFDFRGDLVPPSREITSTTVSALHHHAQDPQLAGYTLLELDHLARSTFPAQRSIAIQTLGRILYRLGKQTYYQLVPEVDAKTYHEDGSVKGVMDKIYAMFWDLVKEIGIVKWLEYTAVEKNTRNLSVRNYAIDALWLWRQGGGDPREAPSKN
ncbi:hypothetical protein DAKH74_048810 [Maudiozyma humilis]|uniref:RNA polymerase II-associated protein RBA50 n=1 Tax=Maudiozyma humilis TaxID=51915 RepID=A0AAV5S3K1_MAUHU|nr:hypothetical protein DAKH74_048810 [Kazachstania humilis]